MKQTITVYGEPYEVDQTVADYIDKMQDEIKTLRARVGIIPEAEKCWKCDKPFTDIDTPPCEECPLHTASGAIRYLEQACGELYAHVPYRIADDVKEKATAVIDFLRAKEAAQPTAAPANVEEEHPLAIFDAGFSGEAGKPPLANVEGVLAAPEAGDGQSSVWREVEKQEPPYGKRILIFSPEYPKGDVMRVRIVTWVTTMTDATHWRELDEPRNTRALDTTAELRGKQ